MQRHAFLLTAISKFQYVDIQSLLNVCEGLGLSLVVCTNGCWPVSGVQMYICLHSCALYPIYSFSFDSDQPCQYMLKAAWSSCLLFIIRHKIIVNV